MKNAPKIAALTLIVSLMGASASSAMAAESNDTTWQKNHPHREQVNQRLANQKAHQDRGQGRGPHQVAGRILAQG